MVRQESRTGKSPHDGQTWTVKLWFRPWPLNDWLVQAVSQDVVGVVIPSLEPRSHKTLHAAREDAKWLYAICIQSLDVLPWKPDRL